MMHYKGYLGRVEYDADAKILHGEVSGLRDVITFQSDSAAGVEKAFRESVDDYLNFCRRRGEKPEKPYSGQFVVRAGSQLHRNLVAIAQATGKSLNTVVVEYLNREAEMELGNITPTRGSRRRKSA
ncbi:MAG TPA: type II toxin-antitoxin system HicB family antitoxin [Tepidisphaeraceae bacterium]|nr:type II toxin-antitoxin system HicB family antitoxin [Tepidisphaeraceae bacterium]